MCRMVVNAVLMWSHNIRGRYDIRTVLTTIELHDLHL